MTAVAFLKDGGVVDAEERHRRQHPALDSYPGTFARSPMAARIHPDHTGAVIKLIDAAAKHADGLRNPPGNHDFLMCEAARIGIDFADFFSLTAGKYHYGNEKAEKKSEFLRRHVCSVSSGNLEPVHGSGFGTIQDSPLEIFNLDAVLQGSKAGGVMPCSGILHSIPLPPTTAVIV